MNQNERGLTLVEVLATLVIMSIVSIIIWSIFFQGFNFSQKAISKNQMQQEMNLLINNLLGIHQTAKEYNLKNINSNCEIKVEIINKDNSTETEIFSHPNMCFKYDIKNSVVPPIVPNRANNDVQLKITISVKNDPNNKITMDTYLYRIKGVKYQ
ncbi:prepilin-type N-terminal cleavage/methylation domain-containing protein [Neobacillus mesonae]|uniref:prepilin-type N-terminal cleavage/methylation domain-containing protein n=1 Tax=Neobacillus mesonae TaxID=1193713 RepID=UPI00082DAD9D|nr:prepilin-type N-terminal cleavage/methylation domain-containing protein [Neobacillus mesonae]